jgi:hypothetical protein
MKFSGTLKIWQPLGVDNRKREKDLSWHSKEQGLKILLGIAASFLHTFFLTCWEILAELSKWIDEISFGAFEVCRASSTCLICASMGVANGLNASGTLLFWFSKTPTENWGLDLILVSQFLVTVNVQVPVSLRPRFNRTSELQLIPFNITSLREPNSNL